MGFNMYLTRDRGHDFETEFIGRHNISWMWDLPCYVPRESSTRELNDVEEHIKSLIVDGTDLDGGNTLLEELRAAASRLPQKKKGIIRMKEWTVGFGISKEEWVWLKEHLGKKKI